MHNVIELELGEGPQQGTYVVRVLRSLNGGEPTGTFTADLDELLGRRRLIETTVLASSVSARRIVSEAEQPLRDLGRQLFESVFHGPVGGAYRASLGVARERNEGLQVVLRLTAPGLAALPWESLYDPETATYVARKEPLVRHVAGLHTPEVLVIEPPLRILGMVSSPVGLPALDVEAEKARLTEALRPHIRSGRVELTWLDDVSWSGLHATLLDGPWHVLHFIGHGRYDPVSDEGMLALEGRTGRADLVEASRLADLLDEADPSPRLVVLNSCESGASGPTDLFSGTAAALVRSGIHAVAAMQFTVSDLAAIEFARGFYTAIARGKGIDEAVRSGRIGILGLGPSTLEWVTPVLYLRGAGTELFAFTEPGGHRSPRPAQEPTPGTAPDPTPTPDPTSDPALDTTPTPPPPPASPGPASAAEPRHAPKPAPKPAPMPVRRSTRDHGWDAAALPLSVPPERRPTASQEPPTGAEPGGHGNRPPTHSPRPMPDTGRRDGPAPPRDSASRGRTRRRLAVAGSLVAGLAVVGVGRWVLSEPQPPVTRLDVPTTQIWTDTGVRCEAGDRLEIAMSGEAQHQPGATYGPEGRDDPAFWPFNAGPGLETANHLAVIGSLDQVPPFFVVGAEETIGCARAGALWLGVNDAGFGDNSGEFQAEVTLRRGG